MLYKNLSILSLLSLTFVTVSIFAMDNESQIKKQDRQRVTDLILGLKNINIYSNENRGNIFKQLAEAKCVIQEHGNQQLVVILDISIVKTISDLVRYNNLQPLKIIKRRGRNYRYNPYGGSLTYNNSKSMQNSGLNKSLIEWYTEEYKKACKDADLVDTILPSFDFLSTD